jgi:hypothetical protein
MKTVMPSSLEIAQDATLRPILDVADDAGLLAEEVEPYGRYKAKVDLSVIQRLEDRPDAKLINVTAITPTPAGEGKTTTSVSLTQGLGVLDWEFSRVDPAVMDLAQCCSTILIWSGLDGPAEHISKLVETYRAHSGREVSIESVRTAMAAYWLQNYNHWRRRQETVGGFEDVLARQPGRLVAIAEFVGQKIPHQRLVHIRPVENPVGLRRKLQQRRFPVAGSSG